MSASREKQLRQEQTESGYVDPKAIEEEAKKNSEKRSNRLYAAIGVAFLAAVVIAVVWRSNIIAKNATALTIDDQKYSAAEVNYYYWNGYNNFLNNYSYLVSYMGLDTTQAPSGQVMNETAASMLGAEEGSTWKDYFMDQAEQQMAAIQNVLKMAEAEGYTYSESVQTQYDATLESISTNAKANGFTTGDYLKNAYGSLMTEKIFQEQLMRTAQYSDYINNHYNEITFTEDEINAAYDADPKAYDFVSYESVAVRGTAATTTDADGNIVEPTEDESAAALEAAREAANEMLDAYKSGDSLEALATGNENASYTKSEEGTYYDSDLLNWLFDDARKAGDATVIESGTTFYVAVFHDRYRDENPTIDVRHILLMPEAGEKAEGDEGYEEEQAQLKADARAEAEALLAEWKAGDATEESFAAMAMEHTEDGGSMYNGGLYECVYQGQMVAEFNDWCFDSARKTGDTDIVDTSYGSHIMYFVKENVPYWQATVSSALKSEAHTEWLMALPADSTITASDFGMGFVG